jgi:hypothetical protein
MKRDPVKTREMQDRAREKQREKDRTQGRAPLRRTSGPNKTASSSSSVRTRPSSKPRKGASTASPAQQAKVKDAVSIVSKQAPCDPAHLWDRSIGGCDDPDCVVALTRKEHRAYDEGRLDLSPFLVRERCTRELGHAIAHAGGSLLRLMERVTGKKWIPKPTTNEGLALEQGDER